MTTKTKKRSEKFILWFNEIWINDVDLVWWKNASLWEMYKKLTSKKVNVPYWFAITAHTYYHLLKITWVDKKIKTILKWLDVNNLDDLEKKWRKVRNSILWIDFPKDVEEEIINSYNELSKFYKTENLSVAVRSSATAEDLPDASFAWQQETFLNISWKEDLLFACKKCFASLFTNRAIFYREQKKFDHFKVWLSITIQKMVRSDKASSWIMFTLDTESWFKDVVLINSIYWLWENIVQWAVSPDEFLVRKPALKKWKKAIIWKKIWDKDIKMVYSKDKKISVKNVRVPKEEQKKFSISDNEAIKLSEWACIIEKHYNKPMDMERAKDWDTWELFIVQARPETVQSQKDVNIYEEYILEKKWEIILTWTAVGSKLWTWKVRVIKDVHNINDFKTWEVLVTEMTDPDRVPIMKKASAIVTNSWWRTCHAAIVSRELWIPCVVWTEKATDIIKDWDSITVSCAEWEVWKIYKWKLKFKVKKTNLDKIPKLSSKIFINLWNPDIAFQMSFLPVDGVWLAREEFIINNYIKIHPNFLLNWNKIDDKIEKEKAIEVMKWYNYKNKVDFYVEKLAEWIWRIWASFYPRDVIVRFSDFKSNEYANLIWWRHFEPVEDNPMIWWRWASRYYDKNFEKAFSLECKAIKKVREDMWIDNIIVMVPFCRTINEAKKVLSTMKKYWLERWIKWLKVFMMVEIPSNVILIDQFSEYFDWFSIWSNDLTQLTLWVDRDSELVSHVYDERNDAVKIMIKNAIRWAKKHKRKIWICWQAPSDFPEFAEFIMKEKIDTISLNPDTVIKTINMLSKIKTKKCSKKNK